MFTYKTAYPNAWTLKICSNQVDAQRTRGDEKENILFCGIFITYY